MSISIEINLSDIKLSKLKELTNDDLKKLCAVNSITGVSNKNKEELVKLLTKKRRELIGPAKSKKTKSAAGGGDDDDDDDDASSVTKKPTKKRKTETLTSTVPVSTSTISGGGVRPIGKADNLHIGMDGAIYKIEEKQHTDIAAIGRASRRMKQAEEKMEALKLQVQAAYQELCEAQEEFDLAKKQKVVRRTLQEVFRL